MLGGIEIVTPGRTVLTPPKPDCVEIGDVRIIGGVRPQNFDIGYRPDGIRIAYDSKTLNDSASVRKNYQNMINDLATEATTVHSRFPYALFIFLFVVPAPCLGGAIEAALTLTLERLGQRELFSAQRSRRKLENEGGCNLSETTWWLLHSSGCLRFPCALGLAHSEG
jgi:hypothetical protein